MSCFIVCQNLSILHIFTLFSAQSSKATRLKKCIGLEILKVPLVSIHLDISIYRKRQSLWGCFDRRQLLTLIIKGVAKNQFYKLCVYYNKNRFFFATPSDMPCSEREFGSSVIWYVFMTNFPACMGRAMFDMVL